MSDSHVTLISLYENRRGVIAVFKLKTVSDNKLLSETLGDFVTSEFLMIRHIYMPLRR